MCWIAKLRTKCPWVKTHRAHTQIFNKFPLTFTRTHWYQPACLPTRHPQCRVYNLWHFLEGMNIQQCHNLPMKKIDTEGRLIALSGGSKRFVIHEVFMIIFLLRRMGNETLIRTIAIKLSSENGKFQNYHEYFALRGPVFSSLWNVQKITKLGCNWWYRMVKKPSYSCFEISHKSLTTKTTQLFFQRKNPKKQIILSHKFRPCQIPIRLFSSGKYFNSFLGGLLNITFGEIYKIDNQILEGILSFQFEFLHYLHDECD